MTSPHPTNEATPQALGTAAPLAPVYLRVIARAIDSYLIWQMTLGVATIWMPRVFPSESLSVFSVDDMDRALDSSLFWVSLVALAVLWEVGWLLYEGATPGKQLCGLFVFDADSPIGTVRVRTALRRSVHRLVLIIPFGSIGVALLSVASLVLMIDGSPRRESVMDRFAGTTVHRLHGRNPRFSPWLAVVLVTVIGVLLLSLFVNAYL